MATPCAASGVRIGTSSWSSPDWRGTFYPPGGRPADFLVHYARVYDTVECDATFYAVPARRTVEGWRDRTPEGFLFSLKLPKEITHDRGLHACADPLAEFLRAVEPLGPRLGPVVAQMPYWARGRGAEEHATGAGFRERLARFLDLWPRERALAVEVRNAAWIAPPLTDLLRERGASLALSAYVTLPGPDRLLPAAGPGPHPWTYVRFLGDHKTMDARVAQLRAEGARPSDWCALCVDREAEMRAWIPHLKGRAAAGSPVLAYFNNHYAGFAPGSAELFRSLWNGA